MYLGSALLVSDEWHLERHLALPQFPKHAVEDGEVIRPTTKNLRHGLADAHFHPGSNSNSRRPASVITC